MATVAPPQQTTTTSRWTAPSFVRDFYAKFPLVVLDQEDEVDWKVRSRQEGGSAVLWIHPPSPTPHAHHRPWPSSSPVSLRTQLLFLLRDSAAPVKVSFKPWSNEESAPEGKLPALHLPNQDRLIARDEVRGWLDGTYPLKGKGKEFQGLAKQETYDRALALSHLLTSHLYPAYLASVPTSSRPNNFPLLFPVPPPLLAGLTTPLPASLTGDARDIDLASVLRKGVEALEALEVLLRGQEEWALGARNPTPLDALIASHLYVIYSLPSTSLLASTLNAKASLGAYVERVLDFAESRIAK